MKFYKIEMAGRFISQMVADVSALVYNNSLDKGRIVYDEATNMLYVGDGGASAFTPIGAGGIPSSEIILFEKNTSVDGFTLLTDIDDETIFISKGAGSVIGDGGTSGGTWTQPGHTHTGPSHSHDLSGHTHTFTGLTEFEGYKSSTNRTSGGTNSHRHDFSGTTDAPNTNLTSASGTGVTGSSATANSWRPRGRIFTRQQKI
jgi:hypothetical protein